MVDGIPYHPCHGPGPADDSGGLTSINLPPTLQGSVANIQHGSIPSQGVTLSCVREGSLMCSQPSPPDELLGYFRPEGPAYASRPNEYDEYCGSSQHRFLYGGGHLLTLGNPTLSSVRGCRPGTCPTRLSAAIPRIRMACSEEHIRPVSAGHSCPTRGRGGRHPAGAPRSHFSFRAARRDA